MSAGVELVAPDAQCREPLGARAVGGAEIDRRAEVERVTLGERQDRGATSRGR